MKILLTFRAKTDDSSDVMMQGKLSEIVRFMIFISISQLVYASPDTTSCMFIFPLIGEKPCSIFVQVYNSFNLQERIHVKLNELKMKVFKCN